MSLFFRSREPELRSVSSLPWSHGGDSPLADSSIVSSLSLVPAYACIRLIADAGSSLPLQQFRKTSTGRAPMPLAPLFENPTQYGTTVDWLEQGFVSALARGNAYGLRVGGGVTPSQLPWLDPDKVQWHEDEPYYNGVRLEPGELLHVRGLTVPGSREGVSPLGAARSTVAAGTEAQRFLKDWYANKAVPGVIAKNTEKTLDGDVAQQVKERLRSTIRSGEPFVTGKDWDFDFLKLSADDAGFVAAARLTATQIANIYGVPPELVGGESGASMTYSTTEQQQIQFITHTLRPWLVRFEAALSSLLPRPQYVKFNVDALIRVDTKTRYEVHRISREIGLDNIDELRALEDKDPLPNGAGQDYTPLKSTPTQQPQEGSE